MRARMTRGPVRRPRRWSTPAAPAATARGRSTSRRSRRSSSPARASPSPSTATARSRRGRGAHDVHRGAGRWTRRTPPELSVRCLREAKLAFFSRPRTTPRRSTSVGPRKEVGFRTLFNLLGPLTNPAGVRVHVNGIFARERCELLAQAHGALGSRARAGGPRRRRAGRVRACGRDVRRRAERRQGAHVRGHARRLRPGRERSGRAGGRRRRPTTRASRWRSWAASGPEAARNAVVMTAAAALYTSGAAPDLKTGRRRAPPRCWRAAARWACWRRCAGSPRARRPPS